MEQKKLRRLFDFRDLEIPKQLLELSFSQKEVEQALEGLRERFLTIGEASGSVEKGDLVVIALLADEENEGKKVQLNVGKHFYDDVFEEDLVGLELGAAVTMPPQDGARAGILVQIKRRVYPPLSDELACRMNIEGVETVESYRKMVEKKLLTRDKEKKTEAIWNMVLRGVCDRSEFGDLTDEAEKCYADTIKLYHEFAEASGLSYEDYLMQAIPPQYESMDQKEAFLRSESEKRAKQLAVCQYYFAHSGKELNRESYERSKRELIKRGMDPAAVESRYTYDSYLQSAPFQYFREVVLAYYEKQVKVVEKPC